MGFAGHLKMKQDEIPGCVLCEHDVSIQVVVRAMPDAMPSKSEVEDRILRLLLDLPQPDEEGYTGWDIPGIMRSPIEDDDDQSG